MTKEQIVQKLTSRKLWVSISLFVSGVFVAITGDENTAQMISGCIMQGAAVLGYLLAEGLVDANRESGVENESQN